MLCINIHLQVCIIQLYNRGPTMSRFSHVQILRVKYNNCSCPKHWIKLQVNGKVYWILLTRMQCRHFQDAVVYLDSSLFCHFGSLISCRKFPWSTRSQETLGHRLPVHLKEDFGQLPGDWKSLANVSKGSKVHIFSRTFDFHMTFFFNIWSVVLYAKLKENNNSFTRSWNPINICKYW